MWYTTKVESDVVKSAIELAVNMSHPRTEYWKALRCLTGYLKLKNSKGTIIRKPKVLQYVIFCHYNYATYKETRNSFICIVTTLGGTLLTCSQRLKRQLQ